MLRIRPLSLLHLSFHHCPLFITMFDQTIFLLVFKIIKYCPLEGLPWGGLFCWKAVSLLFAYLSPSCFSRLSFHISSSERPSPNTTTTTPDFNEVPLVLLFISWLNPSDALIFLFISLFTVCNPVFTFIFLPLCNMSSMRARVQSLLLSVLSIP